MMSSFDSIDEALNIESEIVPTPKGEKNELKKVNGQDVDCLLYTSDAADE